MATVADFYKFVDENFAKELAEIRAKSNGEFSPTFEYLVENFGTTGDTKIKFELLNTVEERVYGYVTSLEITVETETHVTLMYAFSDFTQRFAEAWMNR